MRKQITKVLAVLLCLLMLATTVPLAFAEEPISEPASEPASEPNDLDSPTSGQCGDNVFWSYDEDTSTLTISGTGDMWNFDASVDNQPWISYENEIRTIVIEEGVTCIGESAFFGFENLNEVTMPVTINRIKMAAFMECTALDVIQIPNGKIESQAFDGTGLKTVYFGAGVSEADWMAFQGSEALEQITVDEENPFLSSDEAGCLYDKDKTTLLCYPFGSSRTSFSIPDSVCTGDIWAASNLEMVRIPEGMYQISLHDCNRLKEISVDENNPYFSTDDSGCLYNKEKTDFIKYPAMCDRSFFALPLTVERIRAYAFENAKILKQVQLPERLSEIEGEAFWGAGLEKIQLPAGLTCVNRGTFSYCRNLQEVVLPVGLETICEYAFEATALRSVEIPNTVSVIKLMAFANTLLETIVLPESVRQVETEAFYTISWDTEEETLKDATVLNPDCVFAENAYVFGRTSTLHGYQNSTLESYAETYGLKFVVLCPTNHADITEFPKQEVTCTEDGYTAGVYCNDCEQWIAGHDVIPAGHKDEDGDFLCDNCGADLALSIHADETLRVDITGGAMTYLRFVPEETASYIMTSLSDSDTYGYLFDSEMNELDANDDDTDSNFKLMNTLDAGETYYYGVRFYDEEASGSFDVFLTKESVYFGQCGDNATWTLIPSTGELRIEGEGALWEDETAEMNVAPWNDHMMEIESVKMDDGITNIPANAFFGAIHLTWVTLPESLKTVGADAFFLCTRLRSVCLPDGVETIECNAFQGCTSLVDILIPDSVTFIDVAAFANCPSLYQVVLPEGLTTLEGGMFIGDYRLNTVIIPSSVTAINGAGMESPFTYCYKLEKIENRSETTVAAATGFHTFAFPEEVEEEIYLRFLAVTAEMQLLQAAEVLSGDDLQAEIMTRLEEEIGYGYLEIYQQIAALDPVTPVEGMPEALTFYCFSASAEHAYCEANNIPFVLLDQGQCGDNVYWVYDSGSATLKFTGSGEMWYYSGNEVPWDAVRSLIRNAVIEDGITNISAWTFEGCINLESVTIPESIVEIGRYAFSFCSRVESVTIPDGVVTISDSAFYNCTGLTSLVIPDSVIRIDDSAFDGCVSLTSLTLSDNLEEIGAWAFSCCDSLTSINLPDSLTYMGNGAFSDCGSLENITIPDGLTVIPGNAFSNCISLTNLTIPVSVTTVEEYAFNGSKALTDIYYLGTEAQWNAIEIDKDGNGSLLDAAIHFIVTDDTGVSLNYDEDVFDSNVEINITEIPTGSENSRAWNITPTLDGEKVQPNGKVQVKLPIPAGWDKTKIILRHVKEDGSVEYPEFTIEEDYVVFWAEEFSTYALELQKPHVHTYDNGVVTKEATCMEEGVMTYTCTTCDIDTEGHIKTEPIGKNPANHAAYGTVVNDKLDATCTDKGYTGNTVCEGCGSTISNGSEIPALGHTSPDKHGNCERCGEHIQDVCKWCGKQHKGFFQGIIGFFHKILAAIFGAKY